MGYAASAWERAMNSAGSGAEGPEWRDPLVSGGRHLGDERPGRSGAGGSGMSGTGMWAGGTNGGSRRRCGAWPRRKSSGSSACIGSGMRGSMCRHFHQIVRRGMGHRVVQLPEADTAGGRLGQEASARGSASAAAGAAGVFRGARAH